MPRLIVLDALVVDPSQGLNGRFDVAVEDGCIAAVEKRITAGGNDQVIQGSGLTLAPGFVDLHTHLREPGGETSETIESGTRAAAAGGFTTVYCMPNTDPVCDSETGVQYVLSRAESVGCVKVVPVVAITRGHEGVNLTNIGRLQACGAGAISDGMKGVMNAEVLRRALEYTRMLGMPVFEHCENTDLAGDGVMHEGPVSLRLGLKGIPRTAESIMVARDVSLAAATGGHIHICHVSTRESVEAIREAKRNGVRVTAEVSPHHLLLTDEAVADYNTNAKVKPPLCSEDDRQALVQALEDGTIDCIATGHAPHSSGSKDNVFDNAPFGVIGLESTFPALHAGFVEPGRWSLDFLIEKLTAAPARVMAKPWGRLDKGSPADFALIRTGESYRFGREHLRSKSANCPFLGWEMSARIVATFVDGRLVFEANGALTKETPARKGRGKSSPPRKAAGKPGKRTARKAN